MRFALLGLSLVLSSTFSHTLAEEIAKSFAVESEAPSDQPDGFTDSSTGEFFPADDAALSRAPPDLDEGTFGLSGTSGGPVASKCVNYWDGTAPFCKGGPCKPGWHATREDKSGDGKKCWSGRKVYCECDVAPTCQDYWSGTGPFCKGQCASGYHELYQSPVGNGGLCLTGHKSYCQCNTPGVPPCQPTVIKKTCFSLLLICNNDCPKSLPYICGFCFKSRDASALEQTDDTLYETLLQDDTNTDLRNALSEIGQPVSPDASNEAVIDSAVQVIDVQTAQLQAADIDAQASFDQWQDVSAWKTDNGQKAIQEEPVKVGFAAADEPVKLEFAAAQDA